jgi:hypothetical protein
MIERGIKPGDSNEQDPITLRCRTESVEPSLESWEELKDDIMKFERAHFGIEDDDIIDAFKNPSALIVITRDTVTNKVVGFTYAEPVETVYRKEFHPEREKLPNTAYIQNTAIDQGYIGHRLVGPMIQRLERELIDKGFEYVERDAVVAQNYAANIQKNYRERIVLAQPHESRWGAQVFFRIKLASP